jgi:hypothetical protein
MTKIEKTRKLGEKNEKERHFEIRNEYEDI